MTNPQALDSSKTARPASISADPSTGCEVPTIISGSSTIISDRVGGTVTALCTKGQALAREGT